VRSLAPGGTIIITECERHWPTTHLGDRYVFQFGALGGATPKEYFEGSERVADYLARYGSHRSRWEPPPPDGESPEAEWGFEPALREEIEQFARAHGYRVLRLIFAEPEHPSPLVADLHRQWYRERGLMAANRLLIESFVVLEPYWALRTGAVPFWMKFNKHPSAEFVREYLARVEPFDHIHLTLFAHGVDSVGLEPIEGWRAILRQARKSGSFLGVDETAFPANFSTFARYYLELRRIPARYPIPGPLGLDQLKDFLDVAGRSYPVTAIQDGICSGGGLAPMPVIPVAP
jgi:hypothetical protein